MIMKLPLKKILSIFFTITSRGVRLKVRGNTNFYVCTLCDFPQYGAFGFVISNDLPHF